MSCDYPLIKTVRIEIRTQKRYYLAEVLVKLFRITQHMVDTVWGPILTLCRSKDVFCNVAVVVSERLCGWISDISCVIGSGF